MPDPEQTNSVNEAESAQPEAVLPVSAELPQPLETVEASSNEIQSTAQVMKDEMILISPEGGRSFRVRLQGYDGPLDLLLDLIKKNEMDIYNIQVAVVTQQYLDYLTTLKKLDLDIAGDFIVMAATLLYIKSRMLLPPVEGEEDEDGGDPRAELVRRLLEYQAFKEAAKELGMLEHERGRVFTRQVSDYYLSQLDTEAVEIDTFSANLFDLLSAFQKVLTKFGQEAIHEVFEQSISIEERLTDIQRVLIGKKRIVFSELFGTRWTKNYLIVTFLAVLEIVRTKFARVHQDDHFGDIVIEKMEPLASGFGAFDSLLAQSE